MGLARKANAFQLMPVGPENRWHIMIQARWNIAATDRGAGLRLQIPHRHEPTARVYPVSLGHIGSRAPWVAVEGPGDD